VAIVEYQSYRILTLGFDARYVDVLLIGNQRTECSYLFGLGEDAEIFTGQFKAFAILKYHD